MMKNNKKKNEITIRSSAAEYLTYVAAVGDDKDSIEVRYEDENIWLTQKMLATVYGVNIATINEHIKNIYKDNELEEDSTIRKFLIVQKEGNRDVSRNVAHYNLQMIIAIGFKVDNERAVQFRKWANQIVKDYTIKGWVMDDDRLRKIIKCKFKCARKIEITKKYIRSYTNDREYNNDYFFNNNVYDGCF